MKRMTDKEIAALDPQRTEMSMTRDVHAYELHSTPDPRWQQVTKCGAIHRYRGRGITHARWIILEPGTDEYPERGEWRCRRCRETVYPGSRSESGLIPGPTRYFVNGIEVSEEDFDKVHKAMRQRRVAR